MSKVINKLYEISKRIQFREKLTGTPLTTPTKCARDDFTAVACTDAVIFSSGNQLAVRRREPFGETRVLEERTLGIKETLQSKTVAEYESMKFRTTPAHFETDIENRRKMSESSSNNESLAWCKLLYNRTYSSSTVTSSPGSPFSKFERRKRKCKKGRTPRCRNSPDIENDDVFEQRDVRDSPPKYTTLYQTPTKQEPIYHTIVTTPDNNRCHSKGLGSNRGQLKLTIRGSERHLTVAIMEMKGMVHDERHKSGIYVRLSLCPDCPERERHKTAIFEVDGRNVTLDEKFEFQIPKESASRRLLISCWQKFEHRQNSEFIGCMSFSVKKLATQQKIVRGWYQLLGETLGRRKHLAARTSHSTRDTAPTSKPLRERQLNSTNAERAIEEYYRNYFVVERTPKNLTGRPSARHRVEKENRESSYNSRRAKIVRRRKLPRSRNSPCLQRYLSETGRSGNTRKREQCPCSTGHSPQYRTRKRSTKSASDSPKIELQTALAQSYRTKSARIVSRRQSQLRLKQDSSSFRVLYTDESECASQSGVFRPISISSGEDTALCGSEDIKSSLTASCSESNIKSVRYCGGISENACKSGYSTERSGEMRAMPPVQSDIICVEPGMSLDEAVLSHALTMSRTGRVRAKKQHMRMATYLQTQTNESKEETEVCETISKATNDSSQPLPSAIERLSSEALESNHSLDNDKGYCSDPELAKIPTKQTQPSSQMRERAYTETKLLRYISQRSNSTKSAHNYCSPIPESPTSSSTPSSRTPSRKRNNDDPQVYVELTKQQSEAKIAEIYSLKDEGGLKMPKYHSMKDRERHHAFGKKDHSLISSDDGRILTRSNTFSNTKRSFKKKSFRQSRKSPSPPPEIDENSRPSDLSLEEMLKNKTATQAFREFLKSEYSEENLDFWLDCEYYKSLKGSKLLKTAFKIFSQYLARSAPKEVNIDCEIRSRAEENLKNPDKECFIESQNCIYSLMKCDSFRRFVTSEKYSKLQLPYPNEGFKISIRRPSIKKKMSR